jgi:hypothetical protein
VTNAGERLRGLAAGFQAVARQPEHVDDETIVAAARARSGCTE